MSSPEESERDLPLKVQMRRLFWSMGCSTRLDVKLRAYVAGEVRGPGWQEFTDLDVLAVGFSPGGKPQLILADCKTSNRRVIERMFWVRGVADFFAADDAYLVRSHAVPAAARALSSRIGVGVLDPEDYRAMAKTFPTELDFGGPLRCLFDGDSVRRDSNNTSGLDAGLGSLVDFVRFDYWIYEPYRNLTQLVGQLNKVAATLDPRNPRHLSLFFEAAWLYAFALAYATHHVRISRMADVPVAVRTYIAGGELAMRDKAQLAGLLHRVGIAPDTNAAVVPPYLDLFTDLLTRFLMRPEEHCDVLRYAEYLTAATVVGEPSTVGIAFGRSKVRPIAAKLLADICGFLVTSAGLRPEFRTQAREMLVLDLTGGVPKGRNESHSASVAPAAQGSTAETSSRTEAQLPLLGDAQISTSTNMAPEPEKENT